MNRFDAVLFDLDGTLLYTLPDIHTAANAALSAHGYPLNTPDDTRRFVGNGSRALIERSLPAGTGRDTVDAVLASYRAFYNDHLMVDTVPYDGIAATLAALKARGIRMGVVTNKFHANAVRMMERYFPDFILCTEGFRDDRPPKPAPDAAQAAMEALSAVRERTLFVGDSEPDALTAENTGIPCVLCAWGYRTYEELIRCAPLAVIRRPEELLNII